MRRKNGVLAVTLAIIALIAIIIVVQWRTDIETPSISIASPEVSVPGSSSVGANAPLEIEKSAVRALIASIERPDSYSRKYRVRTFYSGGESEAEIGLYCMGGKYRITHSQNGITKNTLFSDGMVYWWVEGSSVINSAASEGLDAGALDEHARLIIYEELMEIPEVDILEASSQTVLGEACIYVEYRHSDKYVYRLYISAETGLLLAAQALEDGKAIYSLESESADIAAPPDNMFTLPE